MQNNKEKCKEPPLNEILAKVIKAQLKRMAEHVEKKSKKENNVNYEM